MKARRRRKGVAISSAATSAWRLRVSSLIAVIVFVPCPNLPRLGFEWKGTVRFQRIPTP